MIDSHHHLWRYNAEEYTWIDETMTSLRDDFGVAELTQVARENGVEGFISVQARQVVEETEMLLDAATRTDLILGVVGWFPLVAPDIDDVIARFAEHDVLKGARHVLQGIDAGYALTPEFNRGIQALTRRGLTYDILITHEQLPAAIQLVDQHPEQVFVLDHIAKPAIGSGSVDAEWAKNLRELAARPNVACKFSGVLTEVRTPEWDLGLIRPYFDAVMEAFGPSRVMFGSDWPVCLLRESYAGWRDAVNELTFSLSESERARFFAANAETFYRIAPRKPQP